MSIDTFTKFIQDFPCSPESRWSYQDLSEIAKTDFQETLYRDKKLLLKADQLSLWTRWFLEGLASPQMFLEETKTEFHIYSVVLNAIKGIYPEEDMIAKKNLADAISKHLYAEVERLRIITKRDTANAEKKRQLLGKSSPPRCYLCGYSFTKDSIDQFLKVKGRNAIQLPNLVDIYRPRGIHERDLKIEIEHVVPVAAGGSGSDNLRLACGWCNKYKGAKLSIYEAYSTPSKVKYTMNGISLSELPEPFWSIRLLAIQSRCQHPDGCENSTLTSEIFIAHRDLNGSPNPTNIRFYCEEHDPLASQRLISRKDAERIWKSRK